MVKCYTKKKSDGGSYTTCVGFQAKSGKTKPKAKPKSKLKGKTITIRRKIKKKKKVKGVMTIQKKIKGTKKLENKSTIKPVISKPKAKPKYGRMKPKAKAPKKLSAGASVLFTQRGFMNVVGQFAIPKEERERRGRIAEKELDRMFNTLKNKNEVLYHNNITANYSNIAGLKRTIKGREKLLKKYKQKTENYKLIMRKKYKSPRQRGRFGSETAFRSDGVKMLESIISSLKQRLKERMKK